MAKERNFKEDARGNEWMLASQYKRAVEIDFDVIISVQAIYVAKKDKRIDARFQKLISGKKCYNYTQSVLHFLENSPKIAPSFFTQKKNDFINGQKSEAKKRLLKTYKLTQTSKKDQQKELETEESKILLSVAEEKQKYEQIRREKAEFEFDILKGAYIPIEELTILLQSIAVDTRQAIMSTIPRIAKPLAAATDERKITEMLQKELTFGLDHTNKLDSLIEDNFVRTIGK